MRTEVNQQAQTQGQATTPIALWQASYGYNRMGWEYYNRFRYYSPDSGTYISQDPIGLEGNNPNFYGYTFDCNTEVDVWGLTIEKCSIDIIIKTGTEANATMPNYDPPYKPNSKVTEFTTTQEEIFVRVHGENNKGGQWMMHESAIMQNNFNY
ncbi:RHS repeat-associated core domain-containing protein [Capnocytophaga gingivalis]